MDDKEAEHIAQQFITRLRNNSASVTRTLKDIQNGVDYPEYSLQSVIDAKENREAAALAFLCYAVGKWNTESRLAITENSFMPGMIREIRDAIPEETQKSIGLTVLFNTSQTQGKLIVSHDKFMQTAERVGFSGRLYGMETNPGTGNHQRY